MLMDLDYQLDLPVERLVGVDEVGRGPLVGNVVAAAVILPADCNLRLVDSKKLSEQKLRLLSDEIKSVALDYVIASASPDEIDELNILHATMLAMKRAVDGLKLDFDKVLVDGNRCPKIDYACEAVVKGDAKVPSISAASILAKVARDEEMIELDKMYPQYGYARHKGYPTKMHLEAIEMHGLIDGYRQSFKPIKSLLENGSI
ncbi:ribonuclease HII [Hydrogenovibrio marinus]|uniref:Ribonuclease HII n=2 Tax=Hydrogenovibrio marinus TaxID=28885 RepID=A0A066ZY06_HYDMR|nr:ribonuclease HII [Hydrogenovibrio marinus]KDN95206.1 ribonuclease HII [Hydrogenovibrio marinus]